MYTVTLSFCAAAEKRCLTERERGDEEEEYKMEKARDVSERER